MTLTGGGSTALFRIESLLFFGPCYKPCGILDPRPEIEPMSLLQWKHRILTTGPSGKSHIISSLSACSSFARTNSLMGAESAVLLVLGEKQEENHSSHIYVAGKARNILLASSGNCGYSLIIYQHLTDGSFLEVSSNMQSETISVNFLCFHT